MQSPWQGAGRGSPCHHLPCHLPCHLLCHLPCHLPPCPGSRAGYSGQTEAASSWEGAAPPFPGMWGGQGRAHLRMAAGGISAAVGKEEFPFSHGAGAAAGTADVCMGLSWLYLTRGTGMCQQCLPTPPAIWNPNPPGDRNVQS